MKNCISCKYFQDYDVLEKWIFWCSKKQKSIQNPDKTICSLHTKLGGENEQDRRRISQGT